VRRRRRIFDIGEATVRAERLGAAVVEQTHGPAGLRTLVIDPGGARIALWEPRQGG
jgi:predicted enzyme related to lactoylglutathione lyase